MRNERYRLTIIFRAEQPTFELHDHQNEPFETVNVASSKKVKISEIFPLLSEGNNGLFEK